MKPVIRRKHDENPKVFSIPQTPYPFGLQFERRFTGISVLSTIIIIGLQNDRFVNRIVILLNRNIYIVVERLNN